MSEPKTDPGQRARRADYGGPSPRPYSAPKTDDAIPIFDPLTDLLGEAGAPTDDAPTIVSKHGPKAQAALADQSLRGRHLAHFELLEQIGVGGMAAVLRARDTQLDRIVALKILPPDMASDADNVHRFHQEARSAAELDHENIARVFFCGEDQRLHFIAFEYVEGENLRVILEKRGRLSVAEALPYVIQVAAGLAHASERGVVHRDIKPSNIIITPLGRAKLVDMGLARSLGGQKDHGLTHSGVTLGTFDYISPEQALEPREADVRSDIYSLGCTLYHMLTGRPPVPEGTAAKKLHCHQHVPPPDPRELVPDLPDEVVVVLDRMMAKDPRQRYQSAGDVVQHLLTAAKKLRVGAEVPEGVLFVEAPLPRSAGGRPYFLIGLAVAAVVAVVVALEQPSKPTLPAPPTREGKQPGAAKDLSKGEIKKDRDRPVDEEIKLPAKEATFAWTRNTKPEELTAFVAQNSRAEHLRIQVAGDVKLETGPSSGFVVQAPLQRVTVEPLQRVPAESKALKKPTIRLDYSERSSVDANSPPWVALRIQARYATVTGLRFQLDVHGSQAPLVGLQLDGGEKHTVQGCKFEQANLSLSSPNPVISLLLTGKAKTELNELVFPGGRTAVVCREAVVESARNCAFGPHVATFRLESAGDTVRLEQCTVRAAANSAVFHLFGNNTRLAASRCVIAPLAGVKPTTADALPEPEVTGAILVRVDSKTHDFEYTGSENLYEAKQVFLLQDNEGLPIEDLSEFQTFLLKNQYGRDNACAVLRSNPFKSTPALQKDFDPLPTLAFHLNPEVAEVWWYDGNKAPHPFGVERLDGKLWAAGLTPGKPESPERKTLVVDPTGIKGYLTLGGAAREAKPGIQTEILLRHNGELAEEVIALDGQKSGVVDLIIKPDEGFHPILTLVDEVTEKQAALFKLRDGKIHFENLEIRLCPKQDDFRWQAIVALYGDGQCTFKDCVLTLDSRARTLPLAVAVLPGTNDQMRMEGMSARPDPKPYLKFERCLIRGGGDLVLDPSGWQLTAEASHTVVALSGSLLRLDCPMPATGGQSVRLDLNRVTTWLGGPLVHVSGPRNLAELVTVDVSAEGSLFLPALADSATALLRFEVPTFEAEKLKLNWPQHVNAYGAFDAFVDHKTGMQTDLIQDETSWKTSERMSRYKVNLADGPAADTPLPKLLPDKLKPADAPALGADVDDLGKIAPLTSR